MNFLANLCLSFAETTANYFIYNLPKTSSLQQWKLLTILIGTQTHATLHTHKHTTRANHMYARNMLWKDGAGIWNSQREQRTFLPFSYSIALFPHLRGFFYPFPNPV